jgi:hypothetical protein
MEEIRVNSRRKNVEKGDEGRVAVEKVWMHGRGTE